MQAMYGDVGTHYWADLSQRQIGARGSFEILVLPPIAVGEKGMRVDEHGEVPEDRSLTSTYKISHALSFTCPDLRTASCSLLKENSKISPTKRFLNMQFTVVALAFFLSQSYFTKALSVRISQYSLQCTTIPVQATADYGWKNTGIYRVVSLSQPNLAMSVNETADTTDTWLQRMSCHELTRCTDLGSIASPR